MKAAAILKCGPTDRTQLLLRDELLDSVQCGSWFHGESTGTLATFLDMAGSFAYRPTKYHGEKTRGVNYAWTTIGKPPYLTARGHWPNLETWAGRETFLDNPTLMIYGH